MPEPKFCAGYRERLKIKLEHKEKQIKRIERLLPTMPPAQKNSFDELYKHAVFDRDEIVKELNQLEEHIQELNQNSE